MNRDLYINEISEYQDILGLQIERMFDDGAISEQESVYADINDYFEDEFEDWSEDDFKEYILYLEDLTGITNKLGLKKESDK